jgi:hypothetical protein
MMIIKKTVGIDITPEQEEIGLDLAQIGEQAYDEKVSLMMEYNKDELGVKLLEVILGGDLAEVRQLINAGANPDSVDWDKRSGAHVAAGAGYLDILKFLVLVHQVDVDNLDHEGNTAMDDALRENRKKVCWSWKKLPNVFFCVWIWLCFAQFMPRCCKILGNSFFVCVYVCVCVCVGGG